MPATELYLTFARRLAGTVSPTRLRGGVLLPAASAVG